MMTSRLKMGSWTAGLLVLTVLAFPRLSPGQNASEGLAAGLSLSGGYVFPSDKAHGQHLAGGAALVLEFSPYMALEIEGAFSAVPTESLPLGLSQGRLYHVPVLMNIRFRLPLKNVPLVPFLTVGGGYAFNIMKLDAAMVNNFKDLGFEVSETCESAALLQAGAGLEILLSSRVAVEAFGLYRLSQAKGEWSMADTVTGIRVSGTIDKVDLNAIVAGCGLRFFF
jgi:hypothetical protein